MPLQILSTFKTCECVTPTQVGNLVTISKNKSYFMIIIAFRLHLAPATPQMLSRTFLKQEKIQNNFQAPQPDSMEVKRQL